LHAAATGEGEEEEEEEKGVKVTWHGGCC
jgi:hypothetical protein